MKTVTLSEEDWNLIQQALRRVALKEFETALTFQLPNTEGRRFEEIDKKIDLILNQQRNQ